MKIRVSTLSDLKAIAACYQRAFPGSLSTAMGHVYVCKMMEWFMLTKHNFIFQLDDDQGNLVGFCGGMLNDGIHPRGSASEMIQYSFNEGVKSILKQPWLVFHKEMRAKYGLAFKNIATRLTNALGSGKPKKYYKPGAVEPHAGLVVIAIEPMFQGKGLATILLDEFERYTIDSGLRAMKLSVKADNAQAIKSYIRNGWEIYDNRGHSVSMIKRLI
ncbi:MAG: GNAT family N-acetyltransferase [Cyclobacteriaceae bacterium]|nr:GNAT family N-acetyltransferase [Cyclobacteriaceae bacterium]